MCFECVAEKLSIGRQKLQEAKFEVITSEASYYKSLSVLDKIFVSDTRLCDENLVCKNDWKILFGNVAAGKFIAYHTSIPYHTIIIVHSHRCLTAYCVGRRCVPIRYLDVYRPTITIFLTLPRSVDFFIFIFRFVLWFTFVFRSTQ